LDASDGAPRNKFTDDGDDDAPLEESAITIARRVVEEDRKERQNSKLQAHADSEQKQQMPSDPSVNQPPSEAEFVRAAQLWARAPANGLLALADHPLLADEGELRRAQQRRLCFCIGLQLAWRRHSFLVLCLLAEQLRFLPLSTALVMLAEVRACLDLEPLEEMAVQHVVDEQMRVEVERKEKEAVEATKAAVQAAAEVAAVDEQQRLQEEQQQMLDERQQGQQQQSLQFSSESIAQLPSPPLRLTRNDSADRRSNGCGGATSNPKEASASTGNESTTAMSQSEELAALQRSLDALRNELDIPPSPSPPSQEKRQPSIRELADMTDAEADSKQQMDPQRPPAQQDPPQSACEEQKVWADDEDRFSQGQLYEAADDEPSEHAADEEGAGNGSNSSDVNRGGVRGGSSSSDGTDGFRLFDGDDDDEENEEEKQADEGQADRLSITPPPFAYRSSGSISDDEERDAQLYSTPDPLRDDAFDWRHF
jgi:hypothetical protein